MSYNTDTIQRYCSTTADPATCAKAMDQFASECDGCKDNYENNECMLGRPFLSEAETLSCIQYHAYLSAAEDKNEVS